MNSPEITVSYPELENLAKRIFINMNFSEPDATALATHLATADLLGHHSHGVMRIPFYYQRIQKGQIDPKAKLTHEDFSPNIAIVNGNGALGQLASAFAADLAIKKATTVGLAAVGINTIDHTGRIGAFVQQIADANMLGIYVCNGRTSIEMQAPYGGKDPKLATNPIAFAAPRKSKPSIVLDMATSAISYGKMQVKKNRNESVPDELILDKDGNPTNDPNDFFAGGTLLPLGGRQGYKGFGLALLVEILSGILSRARMISSKSIQDKNAGFMLALNIENFLPLTTYYEEIETLCSNLKSSALRPGFNEILLPGERSSRIAEQQLREGIKISRSSWDEIEKLAKILGIEV